MASGMKPLCEDDETYQKVFGLFLERSTEHLCMQSFIRNTLPTKLISIGDGGEHLHVIGVGSGDGKMDLLILSEIHQKHPDKIVDCEAVEPSSQQMYAHKVSVYHNLDLIYANFKWHNQTASEFEESWKAQNLTKKVDFIHMIQMLYYVKDPEATIGFFQSLLRQNGKLLIILVSGESGWGELWPTYRKELCHPDLSQCVTTKDIKSILDSKGIHYESHQLPSVMDISECFIEGNENGELLLDFLTEVANFSKTAPPELKASVMETLRQPGCSQEVEGKILFNNNLEVLILDPLP
ncbi:histamine N-methyltransferase [Pholidichthys leucotaenia]